MNTQTQIDLNKAARNLNKATRILFGIGVFGQALFVLYILLFYGGVLVQGTYERVNEQLAHGVIEGDHIGNLALGIHIALAAVITIGGPLQFIGWVRAKHPQLHRWNGRIYFITAFLVSAVGLYMNYTRGANGGFIMGLGNAVNAVAIILCSFMAWRLAMQRKFTAHKKWALRAFIAVSGVWFFRIGYGIWILVTGFTAIGCTENLTGPFDRFLGFAHTLVPLAILECYFIAKQSERLRTKKIAVAAFAMLTILLVAGIVMVALIFWLPAFKP